MESHKLTTFIKIIKINGLFKNKEKTTPQTEC